MARGITEQEVWKACDALLLEGARPTIERVRLKVGRGSPNTVSPMLETWFKSLGSRIADPGAFSVPPDVPDPVLQAAKHFWEKALAQTRFDFEQRLQERMAIAVDNVEAEKERAEIASKAAFEATSRATRLQAQVEALLGEIEAERLRCAHASGRAQASEQRCAELQRELIEARGLVEAERSRADAASEAADVRAAGAERRAVMEIERERALRIKQEKGAAAMAKRFEEAIKAQASLSKQVEATEEKFVSAVAHAHQQEQVLRKTIERQEARVAHLEQALASAAQSMLAPNLHAALVEDIVAQLAARGTADAPKPGSRKKSRTATIKVR